MRTQEYKLKDLCTIRLGYPFRSENYTKEGISIIGPTDIHDEIKNNHGTLKTIDSKKYEKYILHKGNILISLTGISVGKIFIYPFEEKAFHSYNVGCFIIRDEQLLRREYLNILLLGLKERIANDYSGNQSPTITASLIENYNLKIPSFNDQLMIVEIFTRTQDLIMKRNKNLELCNNFGYSIFHETKKHLLQSYSFQEVITIQTNLKREYSDDAVEFPLISSNDIERYSGKIGLSQNIEYTIDTSGKSYFTSDHLLYVRKNNEINKIAVPNFNGYCNSNIYPILVNKLYSNRYYIKYILLSSEFFNHVKKYIESTKATSINRSILYNYVVKLPSKIIQDEFSEKIIKVENLAESIIEGLILLDKLKNFIIKKTFSGTLELNAVNLTYPTMEEHENQRDNEIDKINEEIRNYHHSLPETGAPAEIDNIIRKLDTELQIRGEIPFSADYVKYRIVIGECKSPFTFRELWDAITVFPFETTPHYDEVCNLIFKWLKEDNPFIRQQFNNEIKQIELIINETA